MKYLKIYEEFNDYTRNKHQMDKYPLNETLFNLFDKYNTYDSESSGYDEPTRITDQDVVDSLDMIKGDGEIKISDGRARYIEKFGDTVLIVFGTRGGLMTKWLYQYEISVLSESSKRITQIGGGYGTSGFDMSDYDYSANIIFEDCPVIVDKDVIGKVINELRESLK